MASITRSITARSMAVAGCATIAGSAGIDTTCSFQRILILLRLIVDGVQALLLRFIPPGDFLRIGEPFVLQPLGINRRDRFLRLNLPIHQWLRIARIVAFVVAVLAIADQVDHHVLVETLPVIVGNLRRANARFRIVAVDVKHRRLHRQRDIRAIGRRSRLARIGGESDLVVDHQVDRAAGCIARNLRID